MWYGYINRLIIDNGLENKGFIDKLFKRYNIDRVIISAYNLKVNKVVEKSYKPIINSLAKLQKKGYKIRSNSSI